MQLNTVSMIGMGALGILFGHQFSSHLPQQQFHFIANAERMERYHAQPVLCNGEPCRFAFREPGTAEAPADLVVVAVKATALESAIADMAGEIGPKTVIVSLLNGISSEQVLEAHWPGQVIYTVAIGMDATRVGCELRYHQAGYWQIGEKDGSSTERLAALAALLQRCEIQYEVCSDILAQQWRKLMINVGINQSCAVYDVPYAGVKKPGPARDTMVAAMHEVVQLAALCGISLPQDAAEQWLPAIDTFADDGMPSMRQDILAGRRTEVALFSGTIRALAQEHGMPTPVNDRLYARIREIEAEKCRP